MESKITQTQKTNATEKRCEKILQPQKLKRKNIQPIKQILKKNAAYTKNIKTNCKKCCKFTPQNRSAPDHGSGGEGTRPACHMGPDPLNINRKPRRKLEGRKKYFTCS